MEQCHDHIHARNCMALCIVYLWWFKITNFREPFANKTFSFAKLGKNFRWVWCWNLGGLCTWLSDIFLCIYIYKYKCKFCKYELYTYIQGKENVSIMLYMVSGYDTNIYIHIYIYIYTFIYSKYSKKITWHALAFQCFKGRWPTKVKVLQLPPTFDTPNMEMPWKTENSSRPLLPEEQQALFKWHLGKRTPCDTTLLCLSHCAVLLLKACKIDPSFQQTKRHALHTLCGYAGRPCHQPQSVPGSFNGHRIHPAKQHANQQRLHWNRRFGRRYLQGIEWNRSTLTHPL